MKIKKVILASDSFKGTMTSGEVIDIMEKAVLKHFSGAEIVKVPIADGGEGTVDAFYCALGGDKGDKICSENADGENAVKVNVGGDNVDRKNVGDDEINNSCKKIKVNVCDPFFNLIDCEYLWIEKTGTAVIETASCAGLALTENTPLLSKGEQSLTVGEQSLTVGEQSLTVGEQSLTVGAQSLTAGAQSLSCGAQSSLVVQPLLSDGAQAHITEKSKKAKIATTYGLGQQLLSAVERGAKCVIIGLGGSGTTDAGLGMCAAAGVKFYDSEGKSFIPVGETLINVCKIDNSAALNKLDGVQIKLMCDVTNPMFGLSGAAYVYAPQKGADGQTVEQLDRGLRAVSEVFKTCLGKDVSELCGGGAAGGMGAGLCALLNARLYKGIDTLLDTVGFDQKLEGADLVFTGEGKIDSQSLAGKVISGIGARAKKRNVQVIAVVGDIGDNIEKAYESVSAIFSINQTAVPYKEARLRAKSDLFKTMDNILRILSL